MPNIQQPIQIAKGEDEFRQLVESVEKDVDRIRNYLHSKNPITLSVLNQLESERKLIAGRIIDAFKQLNSFGIQQSLLKMAISSEFRSIGDIGEYPIYIVNEFVCNELFRNRDDDEGLNEFEGEVSSSRLMIILARFLLNKMKTGENGSWGNSEKEIAAIEKLLDLIVLLTKWKELGEWIKKDVRNKSTQS